MAATILLMQAAVQNYKKNKITLCRHRQSCTETEIIVIIMRRNNKTVGKRQSYVALSMCVDVSFEMII